MSKHKKSLETFLSLPPEVWALITPYLPGEQIGRIKMTGSKHLYGILCQNYVVESINLGEDYVRFKRWPAFLNELKSVKELCITCLNPHRWQEWMPKLSMVPKTLRKLKIWAGKDQTESFFYDNQGKVLSLVEHVPLLECLIIPTNWSSQYAWLAQIPPNLTSLKVLALEGSPPLPSTLKRLVLGQAFGFKNMVLPPMLEHLEITNSFDPRMMRVMPASLTTLKLSLSFAIIARNMEKIPKTVTDLRCACNFAGPLPKDLSQSIPPNLVSLKVKKLPSAYWLHLPQTLKILVIETLELTDATVTRSLIHPSTNQPKNIKTYPLEWLPKSISKLVLYFTTSLTEHTHYLCAPSESTSTSNELGYFPTSLTHLELDNAHMSLEVVKQIPSSVTVLSTHGLHSILCQNLPPRLLELDSVNTAGNSDFMKNLPKSLVKLTVRFAHPDQKTFFSPFVELSRLTPVEAIPGYAPEKSFQGMWSVATCLSNLQYLNIDASVIGLGDLFSCNQFLRLEELIISSSDTLDAKQISCFPQSLKTLSLQRCTCPEGLIKLLPRGITNLSLTRTGEVYDADIRDLPPNLKRLALLGSKNTLTDACIKDLPKSLQDASFYACDFSQKIIPDLPPIIRYFSTFEAVKWKIQGGIVISLYGAPF